MAFKTKKPVDKTDKAISGFFKGFSGSSRLFGKLRTLIEKNGAPRISVGKTQIAFGEKYKYAWLWLPQKWIARRPGKGIALTIVTGHPLKSSRIVESVQPGKGFWTHHILIDKVREIDGEIEDLIRASYDFARERALKKQGNRT